MRVLIVEDQDEKRAHLLDFVRTEIPGAEVRTARSMRSGQARVLQDDYDLVLLDMTLPTFDSSPDDPGGRPRGFAGREILDQMERRRRRALAIVVTQFETFGDDDNRVTLSRIDEEMRGEHPGRYLGAVHYSAAVHGWQDELGAKLRAAVAILGEEGTL